jgi:hypothetical protein
MSEREEDIYTGNEVEGKAHKTVKSLYSIIEI